MTASREVLDHLGALVSFDTRNPPRALGRDGIFAYLAGALTRGGLTCETTDHGDGCVTLLATRSAPRLLCNFHVDTVPAAGGWSADPFALRVEGGRAIGLGACDVKGAAAAALVAAERTRGPAALLFTSDEEAGNDRCVKEYLATGARWDGVVVGEPTSGRAVIAHRGLAASSGTFTGTAGHGSSPRALADSANHEAVRWAAAALAAAEAEEARTVAGLAGIRFNLGILEGGRKSNMIADRADVRFAVRSRPGEDPAAVVARLQALAPHPARVTWRDGFLGPPLPAPGVTDDGARRLAATLGVTIAPPVDFWSEASLFSAAGMPAIVFGPGDIAQAHAADEWIAVDELAAAFAVYERLFGG